MSGGDRDRPSVPHHLRTPTDRNRTVAPDDAPTVPQLLTVEEWKQWERDRTNEAVRTTREDTKLHLDTRLGLLESKLDGIMSRSDVRIGRTASLWRLVAIAGIACSGVMGTMMATCANSYERARVDAIEPAVEAKHTASQAIDLTAQHENRLGDIEQRTSELAAAVEKLNGAVIALTSRLPEPEPTHLSVPASGAKPRKGSR